MSKKVTCYNCQHSKEIARLRDICLNCPAMKDCDHYPTKTVSIDAMGRADSDAILLKQRVMPRQAVPEETHTQLPPECEMRLREKLAQFQGLAFINKILVVWLMGGGGLAEFSRMEWLPKCVRPRGTISRQAVRKHIATLKRQMPELESFLAKMVTLSKASRGEEHRLRQQTHRRKR